MSEAVPTLDLPPVAAAGPRKRKPANGLADRILGEQVRTLRRQRGDTQASFAAKLGLTFQQVQKYESGANRISAPRLVEIAEALGVAPHVLLGCLTCARPRAADVAEIDQLVAAFAEIPSPETRGSVLGIVLGLVNIKG